MFRLAEIGIAPQRDAAKTGTSAQRHRLVEAIRRAFMRRAVAGAVHQEQRLLGVGQGDHQRVVPPLPLVVEIHPLLAFARALDLRAVALDDRFVKEGIRLLGPHAQPRLVDGILQRIDMMVFESPAKVARGRRVGDTLSAERVQIDFVTAKQLEILQASPPGQEVVRNVENVVRLVIGNVKLQQVKRSVDFAHQARRFDEFVNRANASSRKASTPLGHFIVDVARPKHRSLLITRRAIPKTTFNSPLAIPRLSLCTLTHSERSPLVF